MNLTTMKAEAVEKTVNLKNSLYQVKVLADFSGDKALSRSTAEALAALSRFADLAKPATIAQAVGEVTDE